MTSIRSRRVTRARGLRTRGWAPAALFLVLTGLFGMHGLAGHGLADGSHGREGADMVAMTPHTVVAEVAPLGAASASPEDPEGMGAMDLCVAVLGAGFLALLALLVRRTPRGLLIRFAALPVASGIVRRRDVDRPWLVALSILRC